MIDQELINMKEKKEPFDLERCNLTRTEYKIIKCLVTEKASNKQISEKFNITIATVKTHLTNIYDNLGIDNRYHLIELCRNNFV